MIALGFYALILFAAFGAALGVSPWIVVPVCIAGMAALAIVNHRLERR